MMPNNDRRRARPQRSSGRQNVVDHGSSGHLMEDLWPRRAHPGPFASGEDDDVGVGHGRPGASNDPGQLIIALFAFSAGAGPTDGASMVLRSSHGTTRRRAVARDPDRSARGHGSPG